MARLSNVNKVSRGFFNGFTVYVNGDLKQTSSMYTLSFITPIFRQVTIAFLIKAIFQNSALFNNISSAHESRRKEEAF